MKFSLITPSHNLTHISELYESILEQTYTNWEWIIYINGSILKPSKTSNTISNNIINKIVPANIRADERVKIYTDVTGNTNIGYLKNKAFSLGAGDILVELDHDDLLVDTCLEKLKIAFESDSKVGFVYSDDAVLQTNGEFYPHQSQYGWTYKKYNYKGVDLISMDSFNADAGSLAFIWYAPDHVRAWRSSIYKKIGGHDITLPVVDDHDLMIRTYLETKFLFIPEVLYIYRIDGNNTVTARNQAIQQGTVELFHKYGYQLAERDAELNKLMKIDIGGGIDARQGYITIDQEGGNINCDLNDGIPLPDSTVGIINASHVIEHLRDPLKTMSEIYRVLADGGWVMIDVPSTDGRGAFQDPTHVSYWNSNSFWYYTDKALARYIRNDKIRFQEFRLESGYQNEWQRHNHVVVVTVWLRAIKSDKKRPHLIKI